MGDFQLGFLTQGGTMPPAILPICQLPWRTLTPRGPQSHTIQGA